MNADDDSGAQFFLQRDGTRNCKPGIWTSIAVPAAGEDGMMECILRWVAPGSIDLSQSVEEWERYEEGTRTADLEGFKGIKGLEWKRDGTYYDDGGVCCVISTEYLTREAFEEIVDPEERESLEDGYAFYIETLTLSIFDGPPGNERFCIGGMCCTTQYHFLSSVGKIQRNALTIYDSWPG